MAIVDILKSTMRTREYIEKGEGEGHSLTDAMKDGEIEGMQYFDGELEKYVRAGVVDLEMALNFASNHDNLKLALSDFNQADVPPAGPEVLRKPETPKLEIEP